MLREKTSPPIGSEESPKPVGAQGGWDDDGGLGGWWKAGSVDTQARIAEMQERGEFSDDARARACTQAPAGGVSHNLLPSMHVCVCIAACMRVQMSARLLTHGHKISLKWTQYSPFSSSGGGGRGHASVWAVVTRYEGRRRSLRADGV